MNNDEKRMLNRVASALEKITKTLEAINTNIVQIGRGLDGPPIVEDANQLPLPGVVDESGKRWEDQKHNNISDCNAAGCEGCSE